MPREKPIFEGHQPRHPRGDFITPRKPIPRMANQRRGMLIKNVSERPLTITLTYRAIDMVAGEEVLVTAEEVRDPILRDHMQRRTIAIVRPSTEKENEGLLQRLATDD